MTDFDGDGGKLKAINFMDGFGKVVLMHLSTSVTDSDFQKFRSRIFKPGQRLEDLPDLDSEKLSRKEVVERFSFLACADFREHMRNATKTGETFTQAGKLQGQPVQYSAEYGVYSWALSPDADEYLELWLCYPAYPRPQYDSFFKPHFEDLALKHASVNLSDGDFRLAAKVADGEPTPDRAGLIIGKSVRDGQLLVHALEKALAEGDEPRHIGDIISEPVYYLPATGAYLWSAHPNEHRTRMIYLSPQASDEG